MSPCHLGFVYIVRCGDGSLYTGIAKDVSRRCKHPHPGKSKLREFNVLAFDLETTNLSADFGVVLCAAYNRLGSKEGRHEGVKVISQRMCSPD